MCTAVLQYDATSVLLGQNARRRGGDEGELRDCATRPSVNAPERSAAQGARRSLKVRVTTSSPPVRIPWKHLLRAGARAHDRPGETHPPGARKRLRPVTMVMSPLALVAGEDVAHEPSATASGASLLHSEPAPNASARVAGHICLTLPDPRHGDCVGAPQHPRVDTRESRKAKAAIPGTTKDAVPNSAVLPMSFLASAA